MKAAALGLGILVAVAGTPAAAEPAGFCASLRNAWTAGKTVPASLGQYRLAGATRCKLEDNGDLLCTWVVEDARDGRRLYASLKGAATTCMAPLGLKPVAKVLSGVETTSLEIDGPAPNVAVYYPGGATVTISIVTAP